MDLSFSKSERRQELLKKQPEAPPASYLYELQPQKQPEAFNISMTKWH
jgi:hypothetical protein